MKRGIILGILPLLLLTLVSATIIVNQQPESTYTYSQVIKVPVKITASENINNFLITELTCNENSFEIAKDVVFLKAGEEEQKTYSIPLSDNFVQNAQGSCRIKFSIGSGESTYTDSFTISRTIAITTSSLKDNYNPGEKVEITGTAKKGTNQSVDGFIEVTSNHQDLANPIKLSAPVKNSQFTLEFLFPKDVKSRTYNLNIEVYETGLSEEKTNFGMLSKNVVINQIPTSLEVMVESPNINPLSTQIIKSNLYDQAGEKMSLPVKYQLKNSKDKLLNEAQKDSNEAFSYEILQSEPPSTWKVLVEAGGINKEVSFTINAKEELKTEIINNTVIFTNTGNVKYEKTNTIKIADQSFEIPLSLGVGESGTYVLKAPEGEYNVESNGVSEKLSLTGKAIAVEKMQGKILGVFQSVVGNVFIWIFIILLLGIGLWLIARKSLKTKIDAYKASNYKYSGAPLVPMVKKKDSLEITNKADISVSIKGEQIPVTGVCVKIKNIMEISKEEIKETLQKIVDSAEIQKAYTYEGYDHLIFLFLPSKTKTMQNEKSAVSLAEKIRDILIYHNKVFKSKVKFGISVENGEIVAKKQDGILNFIGIKNFIINLKKLTSQSESEVMIGENARNKFKNTIKTEKTSNDSYSVKSNQPNEQVKKFMDDFMKRN